MIQNPIVLAELPKPLTESRNRVLAADINAVRENKKRKRSELAVAIDSEGINLYNVSWDMSLL